MDKKLKQKTEPEAPEAARPIHRATQPPINENHDNDVVRQLDSINLLAASLSHDFNNILTGILGNLSIARAYLKPDDKLYPILESTQKATMRAKDLSLQLQTLAKGGIPARKKTSLPTLLREVSEFMVRGTTCEAKINHAPDLWLIECQPSQIAQVIDNLLVNAIHAMTDGGVITISAENVRLKEKEINNLVEGPYVRLKISDTGTGIAPEHQQKLFQPYFTTKPRGSGLGLSSARSVVTAHGGHIGVESEVGKGTTFTIHLPAIMETLPETVEQDIKLSPHARACRVIVFDDDAMIRQITMEMLKRLGYKYEFAASGEELLEKHQKAIQEKKPFTVIIMDLTIERGMKSNEAMKRLREIDQKVRVIVSSGYSNDPVINRYHQFGFNGCLIKPYDMQQLGQIIEAVLKE